MSVVWVTFWFMVSTGASMLFSGRSVGCVVVLMFIPWLFSRPTWVLAATFGPPPVRRLSGPRLLQLTVLVKTKSSSSKREDGPDKNFNKGCILNFYQVD